jgi:signal transduction histidine kinase
MEFFKRMFSPDFMPHGHCYFWQPEIVWLHVLSDSFISLAYYSIPLALIYFVRQRKDLAFNWMFVMFAAFIFGCGSTHVMEVWTVWHGTYRFAGIVKLVTAGLSVVTAIALWLLIPKALALPSPAQLEATNRVLQQQIKERQRTEETLYLRSIQLEAANKELEAFCYSVSHDLRAPLRSIDGFSQAVLEECADRLSAQSKDHLTRVRAASQRMAVLIDDMLDLSRVTRGEMRCETVNLSTIAHDIATELQKAHPERRVEFLIAEGLTATGDPQLLRVVLENLLGNAWKFTSRRTEAQIEFALDGAGAERTFFVRDNGAGFEMAYADKLFGAFRRLHSAQEDPGTGVGLATVQRIMRRHGGKVWAQAEMDKGATFYFTLAAQSEPWTDRSVT